MLTSPGHHSQPIAIDLHHEATRPNATVAAVMHYRVRPGDSLSAIAARDYGKAADWSGVYEANKRLIGTNPNLIEPGQELVMPATGSDPTVALPTPPPQPAAPAAAVAPVTAVPAPVHQSAVSPPVQGDSSFQQCVIKNESGGNPDITNASGHYGLYQFSESTWEEYGGSAATFGHASVAQQNQVFDNAMATPAGASNWTPYDGCTDAAVQGVATGSVETDAVVLTAAQVAHEAHLAHLAHLRWLAAHAVPVGGYGYRALMWAEANANHHAYAWGGLGPAYDCSGLVVEAYLHGAGISLPRDTYEMLDSRMLVRTYSPQAGDLAFFGTGHVELYVKPGETFGAHDAAEGVGFMSYGGSWHPTEFFRVVK
jgi:cell wall-associated NlpC family hydrolase